MTEFRKIHQYVTFTTSSFVQYAIADFMAECPEHTRDLPDFYEEKRDLFCKLISPSRLKFIPSKGTYFQLVDFSAISDKTDVEFANYLTQEIGVAAIPLAPFYEISPATKIIRFCFCKDDSTLHQAAKILCGL
jgi:methionine aminotransferase